MDQQHCIACLWFCQHYIPCPDGSFLPVEYGHCIYGPTKMCRTMRAACKYYQPGNAKISTKPFSRGEGGPPERSEESAGRMRNAGGNL